MEAWFALSEEMGKQLSGMARAPDKAVRDVFQTWTGLSAEMSRGMLEAMGASPGGYAGVVRAWSEWSDRVSERLSSAQAAGSDSSGLRDLQETWSRTSARVGALLSRQLAMGVPDQVERVAKAAEVAARAAGPVAGRGARDSAELSATVARYWAEHYGKMMESTQGILGEEADPMAKARKVNDLWSDFTSDMMKQVMRTPAFSRWMGSVRDADLDAIKRTRESFEEGLRGWGLPTRSDVEEVQRTLKDLQMEVRSLRSMVDGGTPRRRSAARRAPAKGRAGRRAKGTKG